MAHKARRNGCSCGGVITSTTADSNSSEERCQKRVRVSPLPLLYPLFSPFPCYDSSS